MVCRPEGANPRLVTDEHQATTRANLRSRPATAHRPAGRRQHRQVRRYPCCATVRGSRRVARGRRCRPLRTVCTYGSHETPSMAACCDTEILKKDAFHASTEAVKEVMQRLRHMTDVDSDAARLIAYTLALGQQITPMLAINTLKTGIRTRRAERFRQPAKGHQRCVPRLDGARPGGPAQRYRPRAAGTTHNPVHSSPPPRRHHAAPVTTADPSANTTTSALRLGGCSHRLWELSWVGAQVDAKPRSDQQTPRTQYVPGRLRVGRRIVGMPDVVVRDVEFLCPCLSICSTYRYCNADRSRTALAGDADVCRRRPRPKTGGQECLPPRIAAQRP